MSKRITMKCCGCAGSGILSCDPPETDSTGLWSSLDVYRHMKDAAESASAERREYFWMLAFDVKVRTIGDPYVVSIGALAANIVHPREAFRAAVIRSAASVAFVHNHPSGDPTPSEEDIALTRRLVAAGEVLGIRVVDHVVIGSGDWHSFADAGMLR